MFVERGYIKETGGAKVSKGCCLFLMFFSETTEPIGTKHGKNVHLIVL